MNKKQQKKAVDNDCHIDLEKLVEKRQNELLDFGNNLMMNLERKYIPFFDDEMKDIWKQKMFEVINFYQYNVENKVKNEKLLKVKKNELETEWNDIFEIIEQDYNHNINQKKEKQKLIKRKNKLNELKKHGLNIGVNMNNNNNSKSRKQQQNKQNKKKKLKELKARIAEMDKTISIKKEEMIKKPQIIKSSMKSLKNNKKKKKKNKKNEDWSTDEDEEEKTTKIKQHEQDKYDPFISDNDDDDEQQEEIKKNTKKIKIKEIFDKEEEIKDIEGIPSRLRSPICAVMGHVDAGKTSILDNIRNTKVGMNEIGHITQQIGTTYLSIDYIKKITETLKQDTRTKKLKLKYKIPGLLFIDTPGHKAFDNLRGRASNICDIAILIIDIMNGLQLNSIEILNVLKEKKLPFIVGINKIDLCYEWKSELNSSFLSSYKKQIKCTKDHFESLLKKIIIQFAENGLNAKLYTKNKKMNCDISLVPISAKTGEGIPDLLYLINKLTKRYMSKILTLSTTKIKANILEVKKTRNYGTRIDVILSDGILNKNDMIIICGLNGAIITKIKGLLLPNQAQDMRVQSKYKNVDQVIASIGVGIITTDDLETAVAGSPLFVIPRDLNIKKRKEFIEKKKFLVQKSLINLSSKIDKYGGGVFIHSSTMGSLEALITFLNKQKISICGFNIGPISKKTITKVSNSKNKNGLKVIIAFNINVSFEIKQYAEIYGVKIFESKIIYNLQTEFEKYIKTIIIDNNIDRKIAVFPVSFKILSLEHIFRNKNPMIFGVKIIRGSLRLNTPICVKKKDKNGLPIYLGRVDGIKLENKDINIAKIGDKVSVRIKGDEKQKNIQVGRTFNISDLLISQITRDSIDSLKIHFKEEMKNDNDMISHLVSLKKYFGIDSNSSFKTAKINQSHDDNDDNDNDEDEIEIIKKLSYLSLRISELNKIKLEITSLFELKNHKDFAMQSKKEQAVIMEIIEMLKDMKNLSNKYYQQYCRKNKWAQHLLDTFDDISFGDNKWDAFK